MSVNSTINKNSHRSVLDSRRQVNDQNFQINPEYVTGILVAIYADEDISENLDDS